jgi:hypothetical protein
MTLEYTILTYDYHCLVEKQKKGEQKWARWKKQLLRIMSKYCKRVDAWRQSQWYSLYGTDTNTIHSKPATHSRNKYSGTLSRRHTYAGKTMRTRTRHPARMYRLRMHVKQTYPRYVRYTVNSVRRHTHPSLLQYHNIRQGRHTPASTRIVASTYTHTHRPHLRYTQAMCRAACLRAARSTRAREQYANYKYGYSPNTRVYAYTTTGTSTQPPALKKTYDSSTYTYDSDSYVLLVDNCCSTSITNNIKDYIYPPRTIRANVEGFNGVTTATKVGTVRWVIQDDLGRTHHIVLPNTYYSPHGKYRLLCPQHWAQTANDNHPHPNGTWCATYADRIQLHWGQRKYVRTIRLLPKTNVGILTAAPGITKYINACTLIERTCGVLALPTMTHVHVIPDDDVNENLNAPVPESSPPKLLARSIMPEPEEIQQMMMKYSATIHL